MEDLVCALAASEEQEGWMCGRINVQMYGITGRGIRVIEFLLGTMDANGVEVQGQNRVRPLNRGKTECMQWEIIRKRERRSVDRLGQIEGCAREGFESWAYATKAMTMSRNQ